MAADLPLDLLIVFVRVAEAGGFSAAARNLGLSKATVSKQIAELEQRLGVQMFHRTTRRLALTEAGQRALERATRILEEAEALAEEASESRELAHGRLRIAAPLTFGLDYLAPALPDFLTAYPDIKLELELDDRIVDLIDGRIDAALRISAMLDSSFLARQLAPVRLVVVAAPTYWRARGKPERPEDLSSHACFRYSNQPSGLIWRFAHRDSREAHVKVDGPLTVNNGAAEMPVLRAGFGVALLPDFIVWRDIEAGTLEPVLMDWRSPSLTLHLLTPHGRAQPRRLRAFSDFVFELYGGGRAPWISACASAAA